MTRRDHGWLQARLDFIWDRHFADVPQVNNVRIVFGKRSKRQLGSISLDPVDRHTSVITMNSLFRSTDIPDYVVDATIFHELTHYAHGFNSPLEQAQTHPHAGGVMRREFAERGLLQLYLQQKRWLREHWAETLVREFPVKTKVAAKPAVRTIKPFWFLGA